LPVATESSGLDSSAIFSVGEGEGAVNVVKAKLMWAWWGAMEPISLVKSKVTYPQRWQEITCAAPCIAEAK